MVELEEGERRGCNGNVNDMTEVRNQVLRCKIRLCYCMASGSSVVHGGHFICRTTDSSHVRDR